MQTVNVHNHYYKCEECGCPLGSSNGQYYHGLLLCNDCRAKIEIALENGKYDFTLTGMRTVGP